MAPYASETSPPASPCASSRGTRTGSPTSSPSTATARSASYDKTLRLWDLTDGRVVSVIAAHDGVTAVAMAPKSHWGVAGLASGKVFFFNVLNSSKPRFPMAEVVTGKCGIAFRPLKIENPFMIASMDTEMALHTLRTMCL